MTAPTVIEEEPDRIVVRKRAGATEDRLEILISEIVSDVTHDMGEAAALEKDGVERDLQEALAAAPERCGEGFRLVRREWPTDIGPVDLMCRDGEDDWIAVEIKRVATIDAVEQLTRYLERIRLDPAMASCRGVLAAQAIKPQARVLAQSRGLDMRRGRPRRPARRARAGSDAVRRSDRRLEIRCGRRSPRSTDWPGRRACTSGPGHLDPARKFAGHLDRCGRGLMLGVCPIAPHRSSHSAGAASRWTATRCSTSSCSA